MKPYNLALMLMLLGDSYYNNNESDTVSSFCKSMLERITQKHNVTMKAPFTTEKCFLSGCVSSTLSMTYIENNSTDAIPSTAI